MDKFNRGIRRHHAKRIKTARKQYWWYGEKPDKVAGKILHTPAVCSCILCGNPRKYFRQLTLNEKVHIVELDEGIKELIG